MLYLNTSLYWAIIVLYMLTDCNYIVVITYGAIIFKNLYRHSTCFVTVPISSMLRSAHSQFNFSIITVYNTFVINPSQLNCCIFILGLNSQIWDSVMISYWIWYLDSNTFFKPEQMASTMNQAKNFRQAHALKVFYTTLSQLTQK